MSASPKRPINSDELQAIGCLNGVRFPVASWDKRFHRDVLCHAVATSEIGEKSAPQLWRLFIRYRRQFDHPDKGRLMKLAESLAAPDFRKQQAALNAQAKIDALKTKYQTALQAFNPKIP